MISSFSYSQPPSFSPVFLKGTSLSDFIQGGPFEERSQDTLQGLWCPDHVTLLETFCNLVLLSLKISWFLKIFSFFLVSIAHKTINICLFQGKKSLLVQNKKEKICSRYHHLAITAVNILMYIFPDFILTILKQNYIVEKYY